MAGDPDRNNDFDYVVSDNPNISRFEPSDYYCPFTAHTRKTAPRNLHPYIDAKFLESGSIVRGGLPYGGEVSRLIGFVCYYSTRSVLSGN
jgi:deferrochelatase/peroxidase EfeB